MAPQAESFPALPTFERAAKISRWTPWTLASRSPIRWRVMANLGEEGKWIAEQENPAGLSHCCKGTNQNLEPIRNGLEHEAFLEFLMDT